MYRPVRTRTSGRCVHKPRAVGEADRLYAIAEPQFGEDVVDVRFDGRLAEEQCRGDLGVGVSMGDEAQDLELALARSASSGGRCALGGGRWMKRSSRRRVICGKAMRRRP